MSLHPLQRDAFQLQTRGHFLSAAGQFSLGAVALQALAPPKTPARILATLNRAIEEALSDGETRKYFANLETSVEGGSLEHARQYVAADRARWQKVIAAAGIVGE